MHAPSCQRAPRASARPSLQPHVCFHTALSSKRAALPTALPICPTPAVDLVQPGAICQELAGEVHAPIAAAPDISFSPLLDMAQNETDRIITDPEGQVRLHVMHHVDHPSSRCRYTAARSGRGSFLESFMGRNNMKIRVSTAAEPHEPSLLLVASDIVQSESKIIIAAAWPQRSPMTICVVVLLVILAEPCSAGGS